MERTRIYDPEVFAIASLFPDVDVADHFAARAAYDAALAEAAKMSGVTSDPRVDEQDRLIPGPDGAPEFRLHIYTPKGDAKNRPAFLSIHGGAFILGVPEFEHPRCLKLAVEHGAVVVGVDYRLAPEDPFPAGVEDCYAALLWMHANADMLGIDPTRIVIGGSSAGGGLSAAVAQMARDRNGPKLALQMLFYPVLDDRCETASMLGAETTFIWNKPHTLNMWDHYLGKDRGPAHPYAAPARASDLAGLAPAYITTCEQDPLRDEAFFYAMRLMEAGVPVELHNYAGTPHGFDLMAPSVISDRSMDDLSAAFARGTARKD